MIDASGLMEIEAGVELTSLTDFLRDGKSKYECYGFPVLRDENESIWWFQGGMLYLACYKLTKHPLTIGELMDKELGTELSGVIVKNSGRHRKFKGWKSILLLNGDENETNDGEFPTISLSCIGRFFGIKDDAEKSARLLVDGAVKLVDFTLDEIQPLTKDQEEFIQKGCSGDLAKFRELYDPPGDGFVPVYARDGIRWHRPGSVLLRDGTSRILLGQDDGSYFGCRFPGRPATVKEARESLIPRQLRGRKDLSRQGEWFAVPVPDKKIPSVTKCAVLAEEIDLPVEHEESARHSVDCTASPDSGDPIRVVSDGRVFAYCPRVVHSADNHPDLKLNGGWYTFVRNTSTESHTVDGVD